MDDDESLKHWGYYDQPLRSNLNLHPMPFVAAERDRKNLISSGGAFFHRNYGDIEPSVPLDHVRNEWMRPREKFVQTFPSNYPYYASMPEVRMLEMPQAPDLSGDDRAQQIDDDRNVEKDITLKKRSKGRSSRGPKHSNSDASSPGRPSRGPKKVSASRDGSSNSDASSRGRFRNRNTEIVINGIDFDVSTIPIPVCTCTGASQQCYRWGVGGWQSACCTNNLSAYPLPMSMKKQGARISGRKMSQGAFKKVLGKLAGEGYNLSEPIDLRGYWAKHGTNKFVTIR